MIAERENQASDLEIKEIFGLDDLEKVLRGVTLLGDKEMKPYADADINFRNFKINCLRPSAFYVLKSQIDLHRGLSKSFCRKYGIDLYNLNGLIQYQLNGRSFFIAPPIVETYFESSEGKNVSLIVDGLNRIWTAKRVRGDIGCIEITKVPNQFPLVPMPLYWDDVKVEEEVPQVKRKYRFPEASDKYFFYRDLSILGSSGIRVPRSK